MQPFFRLILMTGRTMPVSTAAGNGLYGVTVMASIKNGSKRAASAITDIPHNLFMYPGHSFSIKFKILFAINPEDLLYSIHDNTPCIT
jgi:hypothetical protein